MKYSLCDQHICSKWWLHGRVDSKYIIIILPSIHGNTFSLMSLFKNLTYTASDTSVLTLLQSTVFHIMAPRNLMPDLPKSDVTAGMWKWSADLVSWLWYALFLWNKDPKLSGTLTLAYLNIKRAIRYVLRSENFIIPSCVYNGWELSLSLAWEMILTILFWRVTSLCKLVL